MGLVHHGVALRRALRVAMSMGLLCVGSLASGGDLSGTYDLHGSAHVAVPPFPTRDYAADLKATAAPAQAPGTFSLRIESHGGMCTLDAVAQPNGTVFLPPGKVCAMDIGQDGARGHVDARLRSGRGSLKDDVLALDLQFDVSGTVQTRIPGTTLEVLGAKIRTPDAWTPPVPLQGSVTSTVKGKRSAP